MKTLLIIGLMLTALCSTSFGYVSNAPQKMSFNFKYKDLESGKVLLEKTILASSQDEAIDKGAQECFKELRSRKMNGMDVIDICVNPRS